MRWHPRIPWEQGNQHIGLFDLPKTLKLTKLISFRELADEFWLFHFFEFLKDEAGGAAQMKYS